MHKGRIRVHDQFLSNPVLNDDLVTAFELIKFTCDRIVTTESPDIFDLFGQSPQFIDPKGDVLPFYVIEVKGFGHELISAKAVLNWEQK